MKSQKLDKKYAPPAATHPLNKVHVSQRGENSKKKQVRESHSKQGDPHIELQGTPLCGINLDVTSYKVKVSHTNKKHREIALPR